MAGARRRLEWDELIGVNIVVGDARGDEVGESNCEDGEDEKKNEWAQEWMGLYWFGRLAVLFFFPESVDDGEEHVARPHAGVRRSSREEEFEKFGIELDGLCWCCECADLNCL